MFPKPRAQRRAHQQRIKARTRRIMKLWHGRLVTGPLDPRKVRRERLDTLPAVRLLDVPGRS